MLIFILISITSRHALCIKEGSSRRYTSSGIVTLSRPPFSESKYLSCCFMYLSSIFAQHFYNNCLASFIFQILMHYELFATRRKTTKYYNIHIYGHPSTDGQKYTQSFTNTPYIPVHTHIHTHTHRKLHNVTHNIIMHNGFKRGTAHY